VEKAYEWPNRLYYTRLGKDKQASLSDPFVSYEVL